MTKTPDTTIDLHPEYCHSYGADLSSTASKEDSIRQTIDIPPIPSTESIANHVPVVVVQLLISQEE